MSLDCPQRGDNLRLPTAPRMSSHRTRAHRYPPLFIALATMVLCTAAAWFAAANAAELVPRTSTETTVPTATPPFCSRDLTRKKRRTDDVPRLAAMGGVIHLFELPTTKYPFKCVARYIVYGLNVNAKSKATGLTPLHWAIKANRPKAVKFLVDYGAGLHTKAGEHDLEPMGYAYYLALSQPEINRNRVIALLNYALVQEVKDKKQESQK